MKFTIFSLALLFTIVPTISHAQVLLSEIAWMGTDASPTAEWIELYNFSTTPTDLTGWTLTSEDGSVSITLSGTLTPHGVGLLEHGTDSAVPGVTALLTYDGDMSDAGGSLTLKDNTGTTVDTAPGGSSWAGIGGKSTDPVKTAQRTRMGAWVTAAPTPGLDNAQVNDPIVDTTVGTTTTTTLPTVGGSVTRTGGGGGSSKRDPLTLTIAASSTVYIGKPVSFTASTGKSGKTNEPGHNYYWNFGDIVTATGKKVTHAYEFPGEYVVVVESTSTRSKPVTARLDIHVLPHALTLATTSDGNISLRNVSSEEFTLDGYTLSGTGFSVTFPKNSILKSQSAVTISRAKISKATTVKITDLDGFVVAQLPLIPNASLAITPTVFYGAGTRVIPSNTKTTPTTTPVTSPTPDQIDVPNETASLPQKSIVSTMVSHLMTRIVTQVVHAFEALS